MQTYSQFKPTPYDCRGLALPDRQTWLVCSVSQTRDSDPLNQSNFACALKMLGGESDTVEIHRFGHWGPGWFEIIIVAPNTEAARVAQEIEDRLADYPILDEMDHSQREQEAADETWRLCYREKERIAYIRKHRSQFEFASFRDLLDCVRGKFFAGYASELIN